ncbi:protein cornichon homolog 4-like [Tripterygium wilfordii]|uniref:protein cornichon homolog 4-like n=1 Tax=Tripterygium wilfordii TaxID=458696 RepID=UPI0018F7F5F0|nr:protein cornichon homolog 4-like [Tripterygium wilfordii]XP_038682593.1 protein cornichon homolog 4-like [Tripterygium wilfordii]XP_038682594.1 protein cornichon homolog 4-like [Tripterygium wilfordii]XP_038682595.1 protein cornichon homolog 4-like [Tripterygium wilfordii]
MADLLGWLLTFLLLISLLGILGFQLMCLTDLEFDYINPYDSTYRANKAIFPEFITHGVLCIVHLVTGHWLMFLLSLPYLLYNVRLYTQRRHLLHVTDIYTNLNWEKTQRLFKLGYILIIFVLSLFWLLWTAGDE